jgi:glutathione synthase/RimK-type ligase-like ATP-grasp enzyme
MSMFFGNIEQMNQLNKEVSGANTYGGRLLPIIDILFKGGRNLLILEKEPDESILKYQQEVLELSLPDFIIVPRELYEAISQDNRTNFNPNEIENLTFNISTHPARWTDGFVTDERLVLWSLKLNKSLINTEDECRKANNKLNLYYYLLERGLPVFDTEVATSPGDVQRCLNVLRGKGYLSAVAKSQIGASGIGMIRLETCVQKLELPEYMFFEGPCLIQGWMDCGINGIEDVDSPSVQLYIGDQFFHIYDITEQILSKDRIHEGNIAPPPYLDDRTEVKEELILQASKAGEWLYEQGYRGTASVDFLLVKRFGRTEVRVCEINARVTGATYPAILARSFMPHGAWIMRNVKTDRPMDGDELLRTLENAGALFSPEKKEGFIPINFNLDERGKVIKGQFLYIADNFKDCVEGIYDFRRVLPLEWQYDRD